MKEKKKKRTNGPVFIITPPNRCRPHCTVHRLVVVAVRCSVEVVVVVIWLWGVVMWWLTVVMWCLFGHGCGGCIVVICCGGPSSLWLLWVVV